MSGAIPDGAVDVGGGVKVVRGGYGNNGETIELPSVSGSRESPRQDGGAEPLKVHTFRGAQGDDEVKVEVVPAISGVVPVVKESATVDQPEPVKEEDAVASVGRSVFPATKAPVSVQKDTRGSTVVSDKVSVTLNHSAGLVLTSDWDFAVVTTPVNNVATLALGVLSSSGSMTLPEGQYQIVIEGDTYDAFYGNQSFESDLRYYVFLLSE